MIQIEAFKAHLKEWEIVHISRVCNDIADAQAKSGVYRENDLVLFYE